MQDWNLICFSGLALFFVVLGIEMVFSDKSKKIEELTKTNGLMRKELLFLKKPVDEIKATVERDWKEQLARITEEHADELEHLKEQYIIERDEWKLTVTSLQEEMKALMTRCQHLEKTIATFSEEKTVWEEQLKKKDLRYKDKVHRMGIEQRNKIREFRGQMREELEEHEEEFSAELAKKDEFLEQREQEITELVTAKEVCETRIEDLTREFAKEQALLQNKMNQVTKEKEKEEEWSSEVYYKLETCRDLVIASKEALSSFASTSLTMEILEDRTYKLTRNMDFLRDADGKLETFIGPEVAIVHIPHTVNLFRPKGQPERDPTTKKLMEHYEGDDEFTLWTIYATAIRDLERAAENHTVEPSTEAITTEELVKLKETNTYTELSLETGIPVGTLKRRISRFRKDHVNPS